MLDSRKNVRESIDEALKPLRYIMIAMMIMAAFVAFVLSIPLMLRITSGTMNVLSDMMGMYIPAYIKPVNAVIGFELLYLNFVIVKLIMKRRILAVDPAETLKSEGIILISFRRKILKRKKEFTK